jgi:hypothetical protein
MTVIIIATAMTWGAHPCGVTSPYPTVEAVVVAK